MPRSTRRFFTRRANGLIDLACLLFVFTSKHSTRLTPVKLWKSKHGVNRKVSLDVEKLKSARKRLGWDQKKMGEALGLDRSYISQLENGARAIKPWVLERLEIIERGVAAGVEKSTPSTLNEARTPYRPAPVTLKSTSPLAQRCLDHCVEFIDGCEDDANRLGWTLVELQTRFPLNKWLESPGTGAPPSIHGASSIVAEKIRALGPGAVAKARAAAQEHERKLPTDERSDDKQ